MQIGTLESLQKQVSQTQGKEQVAIANAIDLINWGTYVVFTADAVHRKRRT